MADKKTGLGRGFDSLIPTQILDEGEEGLAASSKVEINDIPVNNIQSNPQQPRTTFSKSSLQELTNSIKQHGILQPLVVSKKGDKYELIAGERRLRAAKLAKLSAVPVIIRTVDEQNKLELALIENLQREDLNIIEMAAAFMALVNQFNFSLKEVGKRVGRSESSVHNIIKLLDLPQTAKQALMDKKITEGHARQIIAIKEPKKQLELLELIVKRNWSVRQAEQFAKTYKRSDAKKAEALGMTASENKLTKEIEKKLKTKVRVKNMAKGGRLIIEYKDSDELSRIAGDILQQ